MKHLPDTLIALGIIIGAIGLATGHRWLGGISILFAFIVGWKRDWCIESFTELSTTSPAEDNSADTSDVADSATDDRS